MTEFILVRHAESAMNVRPDLVGGYSEFAPITPLGERQARRLGRWLANHPEYQPNVTYTSPAVRTQQTLHHILTEAQLKHHTPTLDERLRELGQGEAEGQPRAAIYTEEVVARINQELFDFKLPGGESLNEVGNRMLEWMSEAALRHPDQTVLVATHGLATRCLAGKIEGWEHKRIVSSSTPNVSLTRIASDGQDHFVRAFSEEVIDSKNISLEQDVVH